MKIAIVITGLSVGGAERMLLKLLERIDRSAFEIHVFSLTDLGDIGPRIAALGIPIEALKMRRGRPDPIRVFKLAWRLRALRVDIVHTWMYHADLIGGLAARMAGVRRVIWGIRNSDLDPGRTSRTTRWVVRLNALLSRYVPDGIVSCAERARDVHVSLGYAAPKFEIISNGFDVASFHADAAARAAVRSELGLPADAVLIGATGRYDPQKNHEGLLRAFALVRTRNPEAHLVLVGSGLDEGNRALASVAHDQGVADAVHWLGRRDDIPRLMASFDVFVLASSYGEAFPNVVGEAMACGVPCAATDAGDCAAIIGDTGRVVPIGNMEALATALADLLSLTPVDRAELGRRARERVVKNFELGKIVRRYEDYYRRQRAAAA